MLDRAGFARLGHDLLGRGDRFLLLAFGEMRQRFRALRRSFFALGVGFGQDLRVTLFRFRQLLS